jgi:hypothetical protein
MPWLRSWFPVSSQQVPKVAYRPESLQAGAPQRLGEQRGARTRRTRRQGTAEERRTEENGVHHLDDGERRAEAEREDGRGEESEARTPGELSDGTGEERHALRA